MVPQASLSSLDPVVRIGNQIAETVRALDPGANVGKRSRELLDHVHMPRIEDVLKSYPHELSGGMRQRVMIALALAGRPELMVADEPTTALDVTVQANILKLLGELRRETGMSLLMIAHDLAVVGLVSERVAVMRNGEILETGLHARCAHESRDTPYTKALLAARPETSPPGAAARGARPLHRRTAGPGPCRRGRDRQPHHRVALGCVGHLPPRPQAPAVAPMSLDIKSGDSIGIVGESGSGKTTLGRMIVGALAPTDGSGPRRRRGRGAGQRAKSDRRREIQMIFQDPFGSLTPWRTPRDIVAEVLRRWHPLSRKAAARCCGRPSR